MKRQTGPTGVLNGFLDQGSHFKGDLTFEDTLRLDGKFEGTIRSANELVIGDTAEVDGEIHVGRVSINGTVRGKVRAEERIEIHVGARVQADLSAPVLKIEEGAFFQGSCAMEPPSEPKVVGLPAPKR
jgi:cytoskeletal protein CcmA (bactofilin family)